MRTLTIKLEDGETYVKTGSPLKASVKGKFFAFKAKSNLFLAKGCEGKKN